MLVFGSESGGTKTFHLGNIPSIFLENEGELVPEKSTDGGVLFDGVNASERFFSLWHGQGSTEPEQRASSGTILP